MGANPTFTVPDSVLWRLLFMRATLVTDATVANRVILFFLSDNGGFTAQIGRSGFAVTASQTVDVQATAGVGLLGIQELGLRIAWGPFSDLTFLNAGYVCNFQAEGLQAADQWSAIRIFAEQWSA